MAIALRNKKSYRASPGIETWLEMASRNKNDPAKTQAADCLRPKTINYQVPEAIRRPTTLESACSVESRRRLVSELSNKAILECLGPLITRNLSPFRHGA